MLLRCDCKKSHVSWDMIESSHIPYTVSVPYGLIWTGPDSYGLLLFIFIVRVIHGSYCSLLLRHWYCSALGSYCSLPSNGISPTGAQTTCIVFGSPVRTDHSYLSVLYIRTAVFASTLQSSLHL